MTQVPLGISAKFEDLFDAFRRNCLFALCTQSDREADSGISVVLLEVLQNGWCLLGALDPPFEQIFVRLCPCANWQLSDLQSVIVDHLPDTGTFVLV